MVGGLRCRLSGLLFEGLGNICLGFFGRLSGLKPSFGVRGLVHRGKGCR